MNAIAENAAQISGAVMVVGGGVAGVQTALDLTQLGYKVYLVEKSGAIGGVMARLDKTFPTNDCSLCILAPKLVEAGRDPNIEILTLAELVELKGEPGHFTATIKKQPRYIDEEVCTGCGQCTIYCLKQIGNDFNENLETNHAAHIDYSQAVPTSYYIDAKACLKLNHDTCGLCAVACQAGAIRFDDKEVTLEIPIGAVILAPGFGRISDEIMAKYGLGKFQDVVTAFEHERLMCASGPTGGEILRISDHKHPKKIAFLQCIGSRDETCGNNYCSSVCCMYAIKQATLAREHDPNCEITLFYMDVRTHGKGFDAARKRAVEEGKFRVIYARPPKVEDVFGGGLLLTWATEDGQHHSEKFDLVVLSQGLEAPDEAEKLAQAAGISLNEYLFANTGTYAPLATSRPGVYVIGAFQGPKDIPDSVTQAGGAAALCAGQLMAARSSETVKAVFPEERDISQEEPRVGVFVCHCGINIGGVVNVPSVAEYAKTLPHVAYASANMYSCSQDAQKTLTDTIREHKLNRLVVAACTPRTHEPLFQATLREAGLNRALFEMANIRDQCSWVHMHEPERATQKAKDAVRMAVAKACHLTSLEEMQLPVTPSALVVGGGLAGMTAALAIADQGFAVTLVERGTKLGGKALLLTADRRGNDPQKAMQAVSDRITAHPKITVLTEAAVTAISGYVGNFTTTVESKGASEIIHHGVTILATGGNPYQPTQYCYGQSPRIVTQLELEQQLVANQADLKAAKRAVMIQCVGSRDEDLTYCSRVCCGQALKNALRLKALQPEMQIVVLYRDMRAYGFMEDDYRKARQLGVIFTRYSLERKPEVSVDNSGVTVRYFDPLLNEDLAMETDLLVLSTGIVPEDPTVLAKILKVPVTAEKFFLEAHVKLQPVDLPVDGTYVCGLAHSPRAMDETIAQAQAAAGRACQPLAKGSVTPAPIVSKIDPEKCIGCAACETFCPYKAINIYKDDNGKRKAHTITASCKGCGVCAARCPTMAIDMGRFTLDGIMAQIRAFGEEVAA